MSSTLTTIARDFILGLACLILSVICMPIQAAHANGMKPAAIIDVRTPAEYAAGHVSGAINIPVDRIGENIHTVQSINKNSTILLYCRSGARSARAQNILQQQGYTHVVNGGGLPDVARQFPTCAYPNC